MKIIKGRVISTKMAKTATVAVERVVVHPIYKKRHKTVKKYQVHDEVGVKEGDIVSFVASKPFSKTKRWKIFTPDQTKVPSKKKTSKKIVTKRGKGVTTK